MLYLAFFSNIKYNEIFFVFSPYRRNKNQHLKRALRVMTEKYRNQQFIDNITKRIEDIRLKKGIVQEDIVDRTGFTLKQVWLLLSGKSNFAISNLEAIANALEVHPRELLDFDFDLSKYPPLRKDRKSK